jgi:hypothetical protein
MSKEEFKFILGTGVNELPERKYLKGSKYDDILNQFKDMSATYAPVTIEGKNANYIAVQLHKRIKANALSGIGAVVANGICYLSKEVKVTTKKK